ncbi:glycosyltransferase family 4 protein [Flavobacterium luminosum]|uniref:Glycosyltransferase family 4 protein n=1 Tax=Flavobacterium luminosum TaxID=2949086 RepID=A0ABT0TNK3_9FLAO|nr:glycosyltransferase family 4 protein [Flavobacterium sp. HXWNR70]MCL9809060.1 glycosyltransferase family 4 protein [Flavobacterium sp. HXWNR70]
MKILYLGNQLSKHGFNKTTIETLGPQLEQQGYTVFYASNQSSFVLRLWEMLRAVVVYRQQVSYVLIDTYSTKAFWYAFLSSQLARLLKIPYIPILHGGNLPQRLKKNPILCKMLFGQAYQNVAPSTYLKEVFEREGYQRVLFIPNTIEIQQYPFQKRSHLKPKLLWVRAFAAIYNPTLAVAVLKKVQEHYPNAELCMVGPDKDGSLQTTQDYARQEGVSVRFTGGLSKAEWTTLAQDYEVFINTTHFDNTPVSLMEAMALGLPVVSTNVGGIPYLVKDKEEALLVPDNDVLAMKEAVINLLQSPELVNRLTTASRKKVESWDWQVVQKQWIDLLS